MTLPQALITGGSRGIGCAIADALAETHHLLIGGHDPARAEKVAAGLPSAQPFVAGLTDALREEERGRVRVCSIHPGCTDTDMQVETQAALGNTDYDGSRYVRPESVAAAVRMAVEASAEAMIETLSIRPVQK